MEAFRLWLGCELEARNLDKDVFVEYITGMVEDGVDVVLDFLQQTLDDTPDADEFSKRIVEYYMDSSLIPKCDSNASNCLSSNVAPEEESIASSTPIIPIANEDNEGRAVETQVDISNVEGFGEDEEDLLGEDPSAFLEMLQELEERILEALPQVEFSCEAIYASLFSCNNNVAYACETLQYSYATVSMCKPCRHHLNGRCMRSDCPFEHNMQRFPCIFWLTSGCINSDCKFMHDVLVPQAEQHVPSVSSIDTHDTSSFPALAPSRKVSSFASRPESSYRDIASKQISCSPAASASQSEMVTPRSSVAVPLPQWVQSGDVVKVDYECYREEARSFAIARNKLLQEATQAYICGGKAVAKNLSLQGRDMNERMKECHREAARAIFSKRNSTASLNRGQIDLHGLHAAESIEILEELVPVLAASHRHISVVTGSGHHSVGPQKGVSRLYKIVKMWCEGVYACRDIVDPKGYVGGVYITIR